MYTCKDVNQLLIDYLEDRLPADIRKEADYHLGLCKNCQAFIRTYRKTIEMTGTLQIDRMPAELEEALLKVLTHPAE